MPEINVPETTRLYAMKGTTANLYITVGDKCCKQDLSNTIINFVIKDRLSSTYYLITKTSPTADIAIIDAVEGLVRIILHPIDTKDFYNYYYEYPFQFKVTDLSGNIIITLYGTFGLYPNMVF